MTLEAMPGKTEKEREEAKAKKILGQKEYYRRKREEHMQRARHLDQTFGSGGKE